MKKIITTIIGVLLVIGIIFGIFWFFFNVGTRSEVEVEVKETKQREIKQIETQQIENETQDDVVIVNREELQKKNEEQRQKEFNKEMDIINAFSQLCIKNGNWDNLILSDNFKNKYNKKNGILEIKADYTGTINYISDSKVEVIVYQKQQGNDKEYKVMIQYKLNKENLIDDITDIQIEETNGEYSQEEAENIEVEENMNKYYSPFVIRRISIPKTSKMEEKFGREYWNNVGLSDNFKQKYNIKKGILPIENIEELEDVSIISDDFNNKTVILKAEFSNRTSKEYEVKWKANDKLELDEIVSIIDKYNKIDKTNNAVRQGRKIGADETMPKFETVPREVESNEEIEESVEE